MKAPRGTGIQYTITNKKVSYSISTTNGTISKTLRISIIYYLLYQLIISILHCKTEPSHDIYSYGCLSNHPGFHE